MKKALLIFILIMVGLMSIYGCYAFSRNNFSTNTKINELTIVALKPSPDNKWIALELDVSSDDIENPPDNFVCIVPNNDRNEHFINKKNIVDKGKSYFREFPLGWRSSKYLIVARFLNHDRDNNLIKIVQITVPTMHEEIIWQFVSAKTLIQEQSEHNGSIENFKLCSDCDELLFTKNIIKLSGVKNIPSPADVADMFTSSFQRVYKLELTSKKITVLGDLPPNYRCSDISNNCLRMSDKPSLLIVATPVETPSGNRACIFYLQTEKLIKSHICSEDVSTQGLFSPDGSKVAFALPPLNKGLSAPGKVQIMKISDPKVKKIYDTASSIQHIEWSDDNKKLLVYSPFDEKSTVNIIEYENNSSENLTLTWRDDFIAVWDKGRNDSMLLGRKNEVWSLNTINKHKSLLFTVLFKS